MGSNLSHRSNLVVLMLVFLLVFGSCAASAASGNASDWASAFSYFLDGMTSLVPNDASPWDYGYLYYDVDKDGIPELITKTGTCEADYIGTVYYFQNGKVEKAGDFGLSHADMYSDPVNNGIIVGMGSMGWSCAIRYSLRNGYLTENQFFEESLDFYTNPDAEYTEIEDLVPGSEYLEFTPFCNTEPF